ncbi:ANTAR domain-containing protein [Subtercola sp. YIM 133946]|uniref:ANTAR domain-containing protein n=1 Tax=Subtercola sp. YIM 133946 TaxID=3118909 RepID=UPI002F92E1BC
MSIEQHTARILKRLSDGAVLRGPMPAHRLVDACCEEVSAVGVSLRWSSATAAPLTIAATPGVGEAMEQVSFVLGEGPQVTCAVTNRVTLRPYLGDTTAEWAGLTPEAMSMGVRAVFAFPLRLGAISVGVLTVWRDTAGPLPEEQLGAALAYAAAGTALLLQPPVDGGDGLPAVLEDPFSLQAEVHQATGMLAAQLNVDLAAALSLLRAHAYSRSEPIAEVARAVIARTLRIT